MGSSSRSAGDVALPAPEPPTPFVAAAFPEVRVPGEGALHARLETSLGGLTFRLEEALAPRTVRNFVGLATGAQPWRDPRTGALRRDVPFYDGTIFHRAAPGFMIQGGDPLGIGTGGPGYRFEDELHPDLRHDRPGILSMVNVGPCTNGSQFFVTAAKAPWLDGFHTVFGVATAGIEVLGAILSRPRGAGERPLEDVVLRKVSFFRDRAAAPG